MTKKQLTINNLQLTRKFFLLVKCQLSTVKCFQKGFTIVEMLIYMGILSIFLFVLSQMFVSLIDSQLESEAVSNVDHDIRYMTQRLIFDLQRADSISVPATLGQTTQSLEFSIGGVIYSYSLQNNKLVVTVNSETIQLNGYDTTLEELSFTRTGNSGGEPVVKLDLTIQSITQDEQGRKRRSAATSLGTR